MVSILLPNYNHSRYLEKRIQSILNQSYEDFELIILDDFSSDNSKEIIEKYRNHPKITQIIYNTVNSGSTFRQWNLGINLAKGDLIWIAESDDESHSNFLHDIVYAMHTYKTEIAFCGSQLIDDESRNISDDLDIELSSSLTFEENIKLWNSIDFMRQHMSLDNSMYNASAIVFKKDLWNRIPHDFVEFRSCGDWLCWLLMLLHTDSILWIKEKMNRFRIHQNKVTAKANQTGLILFERKKIVDFLISNNINPLLNNIIIGKLCYQIYRYNLPYKIKQSLFSIIKSSYKHYKIYALLYILYKLKIYSIHS